MIKYLTHNLSKLIPEEHTYSGDIYKCNHCNIVLYGKLDIYLFLVRKITKTNGLLNVDMFNDCKLTCNEYIIKSLLE